MASLLPLRSLVVLFAASVLAAAQTSVPLDLHVDAPPGWWSGDVHEMMQLCAGPGGAYPPDRTPLEIYTEMRAKGLNVSNVLVYVTGQTTCQQYLTKYAPYVTGSEHPVTVNDPYFCLQYGAEVVGNSDPGCKYPAWGHVVGLGIQDAAYRMNADYPAPNLAFFSAQRGGLTGYTHVAWPTGTRIPEDFPPVSRHLTRLYPLLAPTDIALGHVDFISTADVGAVATSITPDPWYGLYYKTLNSGLRVAPAGGSVAQCYTAIRPLDTRTYAYVGGPLDLQAWLAAVAAGRVTIANGPSYFLELDVQGFGPGEDVNLSGPGLVDVTATMTSVIPLQTTLEIIQNGRVAASAPIDIQGRGSQTVQLSVGVKEGGWIAARTAEAHTGAVFTTVAGQPFIDPAAADYFLSFSDELVGFLDQADALCQQCGGQPCAACDELYRWVGTSEADIRADIAEGKKVYRALRDHGNLPSGVTRYGRSTPACDGPIGIGVQGVATGGQSLNFTCFNAPAGATGVLAVSFQGQTPPLSFGDLQLHVGLNPPPQLVFVTASQGGYAESLVPTAPTTVPLPLYAQYLWFNPPSCAANGPLSGSDALSLVLLP